jgi:rhamnulokinase
MTQSKYLAFDFGAESVRAVIGILQDEKILLEEVHRFPNKKINVLGHLYWDILYLFEELKKGISIAVQKGHGDIVSIGIDTWGVDFGLIGIKGDILGFPFVYRDVRTNGMMEKVFEKVPSEKVYSATGIQCMQINSLYQLFSIAQVNPKLLGISDRLLFMPDLFNYMLTGRMCSEYTIASTSQLLNAHSKTWDKELFDVLGLPLEIMAPVIQSGEIVGKLLSQISQETGLGEVDVVAVGSHDTASAVVAVPAQGNHWAYISSGTWSLIGIEHHCPIIEKTLQKDFTNEGGAGGTIRFLRNVMGLWLLQETRKSWQKKGTSFSYEELAVMASSVKDFRSFLDPDDELFLNPLDMPEAIRAYCEKTAQTVPKTNEEFVRCILEGLALKYASVLDAITNVTKKKIEVIHIVGGGSQSEFLNQLTADTAGIQVVAGPVEATALGNIIVQAITRGKIRSIAHGREIVSRSFPLKTFQPCHKNS